jgi:type IV conjugative transfer system lipoprotein TraV
LIKKLLIIVTLAILAGCSSYGGSFACKPSKGVGCTSVSKINSMVDRGVFKQGSLNEQHKKLNKETINVKNKTPFPMVLPHNIHNSIVQRGPETTLRIWVAPYVNDSDGYVDATYVHEVLEPGSWLEQRG